MASPSRQIFSCFLHVTKQCVPFSRTQSSPVYAVWWGQQKVCKTYFQNIRYMSKQVRTDSLTLKNINVQQYVENIVAKHRMASEILLNPLDRAPEDTHQANKTCFKFGKPVELYKQYIQAVADLTTVQQAIEEEEDAEMKALMLTEKSELASKADVLESEILLELMPAEVADNNDIILEVSAGVGGQEAMLFTLEILNMYLSYAVYRGWQTQFLTDTSSDIGGILKASVAISGDNVFREMKYESGVHRVQRIPATERGGRVHTSTMTVAVLPQPQEIDISIDPKDLKFQTFRASGPGGQGVNKTESAVRCIHVPTGKVAECQVTRTQSKNKELAVQMIRSRLYEEQVSVQQMQEQRNRRLQVGSAGRSEKIRTYNYHQDRITDHRVGCNHYGIQDFLSGGEALQEMLSTLNEISRREALLSDIETFVHRTQTTRDTQS